MLILCGKTASGKDTIVEKLMNYGYKRITTYTTRPMRDGEENGITYHFISEDEFKQKIEEGFFAEYKTYNTVFGVWYYGTAIEDLENADDKTVIILTPQGYRDIRDKLSNNNMSCIYIYAGIPTLKKRLSKRGDDPNEADSRLQRDNRDFKGFETEADKIVYNNEGTDINEVVEKILKIVR